MNKTSIRHEHGTGRPVSQPTSKSRNQKPAEPDTIIIPMRESGFDKDGSRQYLGHQRTLEYTHFEEIETAPSNIDDELALQEYADDDTSRLRVTVRHQA